MKLAVTGGAAALVLGSLTFTATGASAGTVCFGGDLGSPSCTATNLEKVFLEKDTGVGGAGNPGIGNVGSQTGMPLTNFSTGSGALIDLANGFSTIKPTGKEDSFSTLSFSIPGYSFSGLDFGMQMANEDNYTVTLTAWDGSTKLGTVTYNAASGLKHDANQDYFIGALGNSLITSVDVYSSTGIKEMKQFQVAGVVVAGVPEPSTWAMLMAGFAALGYAGLRKSKGAARLAV